MPLIPFKVFANLTKSLDQDDKGHTRPPIRATVFLRALSKFLASAFHDLFTEKAVVVHSWRNVLGFSGLPATNELLVMPALVLMNP